jgi:sialate O-acetylesterase
MAIKSFSLLLLIGLLQGCLIAPGGGKWSGEAHTLAKADHWVLAGQSNMAGFANITEPTRPDPRIMMFNMDNRWIPAAEPLHRVFLAEAAPVCRQINLKNGYKAEDLDAYARRGNEKPEGGSGPGLFFARHILEVTHRPIGLIPCALGGTSMDQWSPALKDQGDRSLYGSMLRRIRLAGGELKGILWYQGESDTDGAENAYHDKLLNFIDSVRRDMGRPDLPFIFVQLGRYTETGQTPVKSLALEKVREVQRRVTRERGQVWMVSGIDLPLDDVIHISQQGNKRLGRRMAEVALTYVYHRPGHGSPIDLESVKVEGATGAAPVIRLHFSGVSGRLRCGDRPADPEIVSETPGAGGLRPSVYRTEFDPKDPAGLILRVCRPISGAVHLYYGRGSTPYLNIVDEKDMLVPTFGPVKLSIDK